MRTAVGRRLVLLKNSRPSGSNLAENAKLGYKAESAGRGLVKVEARGTAQQCLRGNPMPKKLWGRKHTRLGSDTTRDQATALEILRRGMRLKTSTPALAGVVLEARSF
jgi:hypothetical protein